VKRARLLVGVRNQVPLRDAIGPADAPAPSETNTSNTSLGHADSSRADSQEGGRIGTRRAGGSKRPLSLARRVRPSTTDRCLTFVRPDPGCADPSRGDAHNQPRRSVRMASAPPTVRPQILFQPFRLPVNPDRPASLRDVFLEMKTPIVPLGAGASAAPQWAIIGTSRRTPPCSRARINGASPKSRGVWETWRPCDLRGAAAFVTRRGPHVRTRPFVMRKGRFEP
jgi:hypothetical protein